MKILDIYDVKNIDYDQKDYLMEYESSGVVKSKKFFPVFGHQMFKPLSKTKPLTTPLFAYSEVFWSYYIQKYFEENAPRYFLARCSNIEKHIEKDYEIGTLVFKVTKENQKIMNILEYFKENPDINVDIDHYVNYCEKIYNYTTILKASIFEEREDLRHSLENQILLSILKRDENFHYENVSFIVEDNKIISLCPSLDSEFSLMFLYPDQKRKKAVQKCCYERSLNIPFDKKTQEFIIGEWLEEENISWKTSLDNILAILKRDPEIIEAFETKLDFFIQDIEATDLLFYNNDFFSSVSSDAWKIGHARYKENDEEKANRLEQFIEFKIIDEKEFNSSLKEDCLESAKGLKFVLSALMILYKNDALDKPTIKRCLELKGMEMTKEEFSRLTIDEKLELLKQEKCKKHTL